MNSSTKAANKPAHSIRIGRIQAAIWGNETSEGKTFYSVTITRTYRDGEKLANSDSFGRDDLLVVAKVADLAHSWVCMKLAEAKQEDAE
ncbi:hypothetical protein DB347_20740 [Opitutaceae bacterium EW11]|nr:hypothetical protein DB347_20740 [Opitutaceae bacterium EW11]